MRSLVACLAAVVLSASAFAETSPHTGIIELRTPGAVFVPGGGCEGEDAWVVDCAEISGPTFYVDIYVSSSDPAGMSSFQVTLTGIDGLYLHPAATLMGNTLNYAGPYAHMSERAGFADLGWSMLGGIAWPGGPLPQQGPDPGSGNHDQIGTIYDVVGEPAQNGWAAWSKFDTPSEPALAGCLTSRVDVVAGTAMSDSMDYSILDITVVPLRIVPEPATLPLFLLAALAIGRRRRR